MKERTLQQHDPQPEAAAPIVHEPVTPVVPYEPDALFSRPPIEADSATAYVHKLQHEAYSSVCRQLVELAERYNALLEAAGGPLITVDLRPAPEPPVPL
jgi:hypothetical protein